MRGFFSKIEKTAPYKSEKGVHSCASCGLYKTSSTPRMAPSGEFKKKIMLIGEYPSAGDDVAGKPWTDAAGELLRKTCKQMKVDIDVDCATVFAVSCSTPGKVSEHQVACCRQRLLGIIKRMKPEVIILLGETAIRSIIGHRWTKNFGSVERWMGWAIPDRELKAWICPTFAPSYVAHQKDVNEVSVIWRDELRTAFSKVGVDPPYSTDERGLISVTDDIAGTLTHLIEEQPSLLAFDLETTGLKPYDPGHRIVAISFCYEEGHAYAIPFPTKPEDLALLKRLLTHPKIGKIAANFAYEDNWMNVICGIQVSPWKFDTMQAAHILDNRPETTGLKFQGYVQFGQTGYEEEISPYFTAEDSNAKNRIMELVADPKGFNDLLTYCGIDSLLEFRLAKKQMEELGI